MTITPEQKQAVDQAGRQPVRLSDPETNAAYYLVKEEIFDRIRDVIQPGSVADQVVPEGMLRSKAAFLRDLADLMRRKSRKIRWAAYHGDERVGLGATETELYQLCQARGLREEEFYVGLIEPHPPEIEEIDPSFFEYGEFRPIT